MPTKTKEKSPFSTFIHLAIGIAVILILKNIPGPGSITKLGMVVIGVFIVMNYWSVSVGLVVGSLSSLVVFLLVSGEKAAALITTLLGTTTAYQVLIMMAIVAVLKKTGVTDALAGWLLNRRIFKNCSPIRFVIAYLFVIVIFGIFKVHILINIALSSSIMLAAGYEEHSKEHDCFVVAAFFVHMLGGSVIPYGGQIIAMIGAFEPFAGFAMDPTIFMCVGIAAEIITILGVTLVLMFVIKCDFSKLTHVNTGELGTGALKGESKWTKQAKLVFALFALMILVTVISSFFKTFFVSKFINKITTNIWFTIIFILMVIIPVDGKPVVQVNGVFKEAVNWPMFWSVLTMIYLTSWISKDATGISATLSGAFASLFQGMNPTLILVLVCAFTLIVTGFFANMPTAIMMMSATVPMAASLGINPLALGACIMWSSLPGILTPGGSGNAPYLHSLTTISKKNMYKCLACCLLVFLIGMLIISAVIGIVLPV